MDNKDNKDKKDKIRKTKFSNMLVFVDHIEDFEHIQEQYGYNMTISELCKMVRCDRNWTEVFIRPYVHYIYISEFYSKKFKIYPIGVGLNRGEVEDLIRKNLVVTRKSISVPIDIFLTKEGIEAIETGSYKENTFQKFLAKLLLKESKYENFKNENFHILKRNYVSPSKRAKVKAYPWNKPINLYSMRKLSDMMDYGDIRESQYRINYEDGMLEADLIIQSVDGKSSLVHYFIEPPKVEWKFNISNVMIPFPYQSYIENEKFFSKYIKTKGTDGL